jgi:hypothetical protein
MLFRRKPSVVVRHTGPELLWDGRDSEVLAQFLDGQTGRKLMVALDDRIIEMTLSGAPRETVGGTMFAKQFIQSLAPARPGSEEPEQASIQDNVFAFPGAILRE